MKKNVMMRVASIMLVLVLMSSSVISGTFAKYVTEGSAKDQARVAKWGVVATVTGNAFDYQYETTDTSYTNTAYTVVADDGKTNVVAPGTNGTFGGVALTGSPEVAVRVSYEGTVVKIQNWDLASGFYCPLRFNINGTEINGIAYDNATDLENAILNAIKKGANDYAPNTDLSTIDDLNGEYTWAWPFDENSANFIAGQTDGKDTELGNWSAKGKAQPIISIEVKCTVTQID